MYQILNFLKWKLFPYKYRSVYNSFLFFILISFIFGIFIYFEEKYTFVDTLYYLITTATTVGYGDFSPKTDIGKILSTIYMIFSIAMLGVIISNISEVIINSANKKKKGLKKMSGKIKLIIIGYPSEDKVKEIIQELKQENSFKKEKIVVITDQLNEIPEWFSRYNTHFIKGIGSSQEILIKAGLMNTETVLILANNPGDITSDDYSSSAIFVISKLNNKCRIISEKVRKDNILFESVGCSTITRVSSPTLLAQEIIDPGAIEFEKAIFSNETTGTQFNLIWKNGTVTWKDISILFMENDAIAEGFSKDKNIFNFLPNKNDLIEDNYIIKYRSEKRICL